VRTDGQSKDDTEEDDDFKYHASIRPKYFLPGSTYNTKSAFSKIHLPSLPAQQGGNRK
jgi:hypothetical protein